MSFMDYTLEELALMSGRSLAVITFWEQEGILEERINAMKINGVLKSLEEAKRDEAIRLREKELKRNRKQREAELRDLLEAKPEKVKPLVFEVRRLHESIELEPVMEPPPKPLLEEVIDEKITKEVSSIAKEPIQEQITEEEGFVCHHCGKRDPLWCICRECVEAGITHEQLGLNIYECEQKYYGKL